MSTRSVGAENGRATTRRLIDRALTYEAVALEGLSDNDAAMRRATLNRIFANIGRLSSLVGPMPATGSEHSIDGNRDPDQTNSSHFTARYTTFPVNRGRIPAENDQRGILMQGLEDLLGHGNIFPCPRRLGTKR